MWGCQLRRVQNRFRAMGPCGRCSPRSNKHSPVSGPLTANGKLEPGIVSLPGSPLCGSHTSLLLLAPPGPWARAPGAGAGHCLCPCGFHCVTRVGWCLDAGWEGWLCRAVLGCFGKRRDAAGHGVCCRHGGDELKRWGFLRGAGRGFSSVTWCLFPAPSIPEGLHRGPATSLLRGVGDLHGSVGACGRPGRGCGVRGEQLWLPAPTQCCEQTLS